LAPAALLLREPVGAAQLTGAACVLGAVMLATLAQALGTRNVA
jgi:drug/metabolite transporter (DMT)-like permease